MAYRILRRNIPFNIKIAQMTHRPGDAVQNLSLPDNPEELTALPDEQ